MPFVLLPFGSPYLSGETSRDWFGIAVALADVDGDGVADLIVGAPGEDSAGTEAGAVYIFFALAAGETPTADQVLYGAGEGEGYGTSLAVLGDADGDGYPLVAIGAPALNSASELGSVSLHHGGLSGLSTAGITLSSGTSGDAFGTALANPDIDADGDLDLFVGAPSAAGGGTERGTIYGAENVDNRITLSGVEMLGFADDDHLGAVLLSAGDVDNDGDDELFAGVPDTVGTFADSGSLYLYFGDSAGVATTPDWTYAPGFDTYQLGISLAAGDWNGDGYSDLLAGASYGDTDQAMAFDGASGGPSTTPSWTLPSVIEDGDIRVGALGDLNADGYDEAAVVIYSDTYGDCGGEYLGMSSVITGGAGGLSTTIPVLAHEPAAILGAGDLDGNGLGDVLLATLDGEGAVSAHLGVLDNDSDGYYADYGGELLDCDDSDAAVYFGAPETDGDGLDSDCDGEDNSPLSTHTTTCLSITTVAEAYAIKDSVGSAVLDVESAVYALMANTGVCNVSGPTLDNDAHYMEITERGCSGHPGTVWSFADSSRTYTNWPICESNDNEDTTNRVALQSGTAVSEGATGARVEYTVTENSNDYAESRSSAVRGTLSWEDGTTSVVSVNEEYSVMLWDWFTIDERSLSVDGCTFSHTHSSRDADIEWTMNDGTHEFWYIALDGRVCDSSFSWPDLAWAEVDGVGAVVDAVTWEPTGSPDADGDGWPAAYGDCDDTNVAIHPCAIEDGVDFVDHDCDGDSETDSDQDGTYDSRDCSPFDANYSDNVTQYVDADADGFGFSLWPDLACEVLPGNAANDDDCDDTDAAIYPGATELCDGIDHDCDGETYDADAETGPDRYFDFDEDGFGIEGGLCVPSCEPTAHCTALIGDCNDHDASVYPGAPEILNDGINSDCTGAPEIVREPPEMPTGSPEKESPRPKPETEPEPKALGCASGLGLIGLIPVFSSVGRRRR